MADITVKEGDAVTWLSGSLRLEGRLIHIDNATNKGWVRQVTGLNPGFIYHSLSVSSLVKLVRVPKEGDVVRSSSSLMSSALYTVLHVHREYLWIVSSAHPELNPLTVLAQHVEVVE